MRKRQLFIPILLCLIIPIFLYLLGAYVLNLLQDYERSETAKVKEWQHKHQPELDDDVAPPDYIPRTTRLPVIEEDSEEDIEWITASTRKVPVVTTEEPTTSTVSPSTTAFVTESTTEFSTEFTTQPTTESTTQYVTEPPTTTSTPSSTSTTTTPTTTTSTTEAPTTTRIRTWTFPTRRPPIYDPDRHRYGQDRVNHHQHHQHHHHGHHDKTTTTPPTTTSTTTTSAPSTTEQTTRIRVTTPRYYTSSYPSGISSSSSNSIYDRITIPSIPATSSYRNPYIHKIEVTSSTYRTPDVQPTTSTHRHHHHHHHNRTHIDIHSHHRHHIPYPQFPYPHFPNILYPTPTTTTTEKTTTSTTEAPTTTTEPETTTTVEETTTSRRQHHHGHHGHHRHHHSSTARPTTTTTRESELDRWGFVESIEDLSYEEEKSSTPTPTTTTTSTTTTTTTTTPAPMRIPERSDVPRHRQPEPTQAPIKRVEREVTIVTGFLDIGRGDWDQYRRPLETYHQFMETLLTLQNNFVVFTDDSSYDFVVKTRTKLGLMDKTVIHKITLNDLPLYSFVNEAKKIIDDELKNETFYRTVADLDMRTHPESISAEYNIVVNSKTFFLHNVTIENPFKSEHFVWIDAGYGHANENHFPYNYHWRPALPDGKISLIKVTPDFDSLKDYNLQKLYRKNVALISGGFIAGDKHAIGQLHSIIHRKFIQLIYQNHVDDDQTLLTLAVNTFPQLFHVIHGDWFDAFRLFASDPEVQMG